MVGYGADINNNHSVGATALHVASYNGHIEIVEFLLSHGANPTIVDHDGHNCLHDAKHSKNLKLEKLILDAIKNYKK